MPHFLRRTPAPIVSGGYRAFRPFVREDFSRQCAFCLFSELVAGGEEAFELDHFRPKHRFPELLNDFYNLYYSCHPCNHIKRDSWPPPALEEQGICFVDLCKEDFASHFSVEKDGTWNGLTNPGNYTIDKLNLNRQHLVIVRGLLERLGIHIHQETISEERLTQLLKSFGYDRRIW
ncbi:MAG TPA: hypothetical protein VN643_11345 [Pyrinomonadaceae bacterium]|nr:hypothetical protein [Pyrinomonadaceae bacterium]